MWAIAGGSHDGLHEERGEGSQEEGAMSRERFCHAACSEDGDTSAPLRIWPCGLV